MPERRRPTIDEVAARAGVSPSTVSRVLNGKTDVAAGTRTRVQEVIRQLAFSPALTAQRLASGQGRTLALLFPGRYASVSSFGLEMVLAVAQAAGRHGYSCSLVVDRVDEHDLLDLFRSRSTDGAVLMLVEWEDERVRVLSEQGLPFVGIGRPASAGGMSYVDIDEEAVVTQLVDYLVTLGHSRIAFMSRSGPVMGMSVRLEQGFERAVERHRLDGTDVISSELDPAAAGRAALELLDREPDVRAFVTTHWAVAAGVISALAEGGRRVPQDVSVVGIAPTAMAEATIPALTGVSYPADEMGQLAVDILVHQLRQRSAGREPEPEHSLLLPGITIRRSAAPPPVRR